MPYGKHFPNESWLLCSLYCVWAYIMIWEKANSKSDFRAYISKQFLAEDPQSTCYPERYSIPPDPFGSLQFWQPTHFFRNRALVVCCIYFKKLNVCNMIAQDALVCGTYVLFINNNSYRYLFIINKSLLTTVFLTTFWSKYCTIICLLVV